MMRDAAISAGLVQSAHAGDRDWRDRLRIITYVSSVIIASFMYSQDGEGNPKQPQCTARI